MTWCIQQKGNRFKLYFQFCNICQLFAFSGLSWVPSPSSFLAPDHPPDPGSKIPGENKHSILVQTSQQTCQAETKPTHRQTPMEKKPRANTRPNSAVQWWTHEPLAQFAWTLRLSLLQLSLQSVELQPPVIQKPNGRIHTILASSYHPQRQGTLYWLAFPPTSPGKHLLPSASRTETC